jgi:hypothetical protein
MITITKVDTEEPQQIVAAASAKPEPMKRTYPKGILKTKRVKIFPSSNPSRPPPLRKSTRKQTIKFLSDEKVNERRRTIRKRISNMSDRQVREALVKANLSDGGAPQSLMRKIMENAIISGFIS